MFSWVERWRERREEDGRPPGGEKEGRERRKKKLEYETAAMTRKYE